MLSQRSETELRRGELDSLRYDHSNASNAVASHSKDGKRMRMPSKKLDDFGLNLDAASSNNDYEKANPTNSYMDR